MNKHLELGFMRHNVDNPGESQKIVDYAFEVGQPYFETCYFYLDNKCEQFIYPLLSKYKREDYYLCGKAPIHGIVEQIGIKQLFEEQISRVPGGYFDTYLLQALDSRATIILKEKNVIPYLLEQKRKGLIKRFGLSIQCTPEEFEQFLKLNCWEVVQMTFNYYDWFTCRQNELYELACKYNLPIIAQAPMKGGLLARVNHDNPTKFAMDFINSLDNIELVLTGCSKLSTYQDTYNNLNNKLNNVNLEEYKKVLQEYLNKTYIKCINCNKCVKNCHKKLPLTAIINLYNKCLNLDDPLHIGYFNSMDILNNSIPQFGRTCDNCRKCVEVCPVHLNIPRLLHETFEMRT